MLCLWNVCLILSISIELVCGFCFQKSGIEALVDELCSRLKDSEIQGKWFSISICQAQLAVQPGIWQ